jgi:glycosyltransferase involved in cell wall biosynthesis
MAFGFLIQIAASATLAVIWLWHAGAAVLGMRRIPDITADEWDRQPDDRLPSVSIVVPARDEQSMIRAAVESLLALEYPNFEVIAVDDRSSDNTGIILDELAALAHGRLKTIHVRELPPGWLGKTHAMHLAASRSKSEWILFTDADVIHRPDTLRRAVAFAERVCADHAVVLPTVVMESWGERMMIALFQALFIFAHRPWKASDPNAKDHVGMGAFNLIRRSVYDEIGGYERLRLAVIDDLRLGAAVKQARRSQAIAFGKDLVRVRWAQGLMGVVRNTQKNFFAEFGFNLWLTSAAVLGVLALQLGPWVGSVIAHGWSRVGYVIALLCVFWTYKGAARTSISAWYFLLHPLAVVLLVYAILRSTLVTLANGGVVWRGTKYELNELRRAVRDSK